MDNNSLLVVIKEYNEIISQETGLFYSNLSEIRESKLKKIISMLSKYEDNIINSHNKYSEIGKQFSTLYKEVPYEEFDIYTSKISNIEVYIMEYMEYKIYLHYLIYEYNMYNNPLLEAIRKCDTFIAQVTNNFHLSLSKTSEKSLIKIISTLSEIEEVIINYYNKVNFESKENLILEKDVYYLNTPLSCDEQECATYLAYKVYIHYLIYECDTNVQ